MYLYITIVCTIMTPELQPVFQNYKVIKKNKHSRQIQLQCSALILTGILIFFLKIWDLVMQLLTLIKENCTMKITFNIYIVCCSFNSQRTSTNKLSKQLRFILKTNQMFPHSCLIHVELLLLLGYIVSGVHTMTASDKSRLPHA